jgi:hypothetical protein
MDDQFNIKSNCLQLSKMTVVVRVQQLFLSKTAKVTINLNASVFAYPRISNLNILLFTTLRNLVNLKSPWILKKQKSQKTINKIFFTF